MQAFDRISVNTLQNVLKIFPGIDLVLSTSGNERHQCSGGMPAGLTTDE